MMYHVEVQAIDGWTRHTSWESYRDAVDQADMVHGRVTLASGATDREAHAYAHTHQGFGGNYEEWQRLDDAERDAYERGAAGEPTD